MRSELFTIPGPWPGRLAIVPRPRGSDWLEDEIRGWSRAGVDCVVSLLTETEEDALALAEEARYCRENGIEFISYPIEDRTVPASRAAFSELIARLTAGLAGGKTVAVHCRQGIGRAATVAISILVSSGVEAESAILSASAARGQAVPETAEQRNWIRDYAREQLPQVPA